MAKFSTRLFIKLVTLLFFAGNVLLLILTIISGTTQHYPVNRFYWIEADTDGIPNASSLTRWTFWGACDNINDRTVCSDNLAAAYPISPVDNFHTETNVPHKFVSNRDAFYYLSRFSFCFYWIALAFIGVSFILYILSWCSEVILQVIFILMAFGCVFNVCAVILQTAATAMAKRAFKDGDRKATIGAALMGIGWASVVVSIWEFVALAVWFTSDKIRDHYRNNPQSLSEKRHNNFFHRDTEPLDMQGQPVMDAYSPAPPNVASNTATMVNPGAYTAAEGANTSLPIVQEPLTVPTPAAAPPPETNAHRGINFFHIRRTQKQNPDDVSV